MDHAVSWGMDQGMDRGVWTVCGSGALIHTLYFDSYPYVYLNKIRFTICISYPSMEPKNQQLLYFFMVLRACLLMGWESRNLLLVNLCVTGKCVKKHRDKSIHPLVN